MNDVLGLRALTAADFDVVDLTPVVTAHADVCPYWVNRGGAKRSLTSVTSESRAAAG